MIGTNQCKAGGEKGIVSLLTAIIVSILLSIMTVGMVVVMASEHQQSIDSDQSTAAFYAADSGIENGILNIKTALRSGTPLVEQTSCAGTEYDLVNNTPTPPAQLGWTCQLVTIKTNKLTDNLSADEAAQIEPGLGIGFDRVRVSWQQDGVDPTPSGGFVSPGVFTPGVNWRFPAVMELTALSYNSGSSVRPASPTSASGVRIETATVAPANGSSGIGSASVGTAGAQSANCGNAGDYRCQVDIGGFSATRDYIIRLRTRYTGTHFKMEFFGTGPTCVAGGPCKVADQYATIDVTGKSGNVFRRIVAKTPINFGVASGLDFVLFSDNDICKDFFVTSNSAQSTNPQCPAP